MNFRTQCSDQGSLIEPTITRGIFVFLLLLSILYSCATTKSFDNFPRKMIDRPYTLPSGIDAWRTIAPGSLGVDENGNSHVSYPIPIPLFWQQSLAEDWELQWAVIPIGISHQFSADANGYVGGQLGLLPAYDENLGWGVSPTLYNENLSRLSNVSALVYGGSLGSTIYFSGGPMILTGDVSVAPIYQVTSEIAVAVRPDLKFSYNSDFSRTEGNKRISTSQKLLVTLPLQTTLRWSASKQWDFNIDYTLNYLGLAKGSYSHDFTFTLLNYW